jgi:hypothetical protein
MGEFDSPLILTTPPIRGQKVKDAQWRLAGHNRFQTFTHPIHPYEGRIDGVYGPATAAASRRAKFWLGYPEESIRGMFGQVIYDYLTDKELPPELLARREFRIKALNQEPKQKLLKWALGEQGVKEHPFGSNMQKYGAWYGMNGVPWCAIFISFGMHVVNKSWRYSYVPSVVQDAMYGRNGMHLTLHPQPGDLVSYTFHGTRDAHIAIFHSWIDSYNFFDVGGNTGPINMSNGGEVLKQERHTYQVSHFIRLW